MVLSSRVRSPSSVRVGKNSTEIVGRAAPRASARMSRMKRIWAERGSAPEIVARQWPSLLGNFRRYLRRHTPITADPGRSIRLLYTMSLYDPHMRRTRLPARSIRFVLAIALAVGLAAMTGAAQQF